MDSRRPVGTILVSVLLVVHCYLTTSCHGLIAFSPDQLKLVQQLQASSSSPSSGPLQDLVHVLESSRPIRWSGVKQLSELAPESQVVEVHFALANNQAASLNSRSDTNKTKQSQEFDIHQQHQQQQQQGSSLRPPPPAPVVASTQFEAKPTPAQAIPVSSSASPPTSEQPTTTTTATMTTTVATTTTTTTSTSTSTTTAAAATSAETAGWPQRPPPPTSAPSTESPSPPPPLPVGSKVERQGAAVLCGEANANGKSNKRLISDRIVGGHKTEPGEFPFQVRLNIRSRRGSGICGGVVLDGHHILTAAHCMTACVSQHLTTATIESSGVKATIGDHSIKSNDGEQELDVESITAHEKYDACNFYANDHDIAIIKTVQPIEYRFTSDGYGSINRPCMPQRSDSIYTDGDQVIVSGWGVTRENSGTLSNILRYVQVPIVNVTRCQETYGSRVTQDHICAGYQVGGKDSCQGDSGGPLVRVVENRYELVGIVSFGYGCGQPGAPGVYTRVASYLDWIRANL